MKQYIDTGKKDTRSGFGDALAELGAKDERIVALTADLKGSVKMDKFAKAFPERFFQGGIAEANLVGVAAGLAITGKIPFVSSFAEFITGRVYDQIRQEVAYGGTNVKIAASHAGLTVGEDGATHQTMEDVALMRALPGMVVLVPCDYNQTLAATRAAAAWDGPVYLRFGRPGVPNFTDPDAPFEIGKAVVLSEGDDVTLVANGHLVWPALEAARLLEEEGIHADVLDMATVKPLDEEALLSSVSRTGAVVCAEEHNMPGSLGEMIAGVLALKRPAPMEFVNGGDRFGQSGTPSQLLSAAGLDAAGIVAAVRRVLSRK